VELRDLIVTPLLLLILYTVAFFVRPYLTDEITRRYFIPALTVRIIGALAVGFIYQFYYDGGDTFAYHTHGSRHIWNAVMESPSDGLRVFFANGQYGDGLWAIAEKIWYWRDPHAFFVIRIAAIFDLITFSSYSGTATLFAVVAFIGAWLLFKTFYKILPDFHGWIAACTLFIPTVVFWGSGIFKDSITLAALGFATFCFHAIFIERRFKIRHIVFLLLSCWIIYSIKKYILLSFIPAILVWWFARQLAKLRSPMLKIILVPFVSLIAGWLAFTAVLKVGEDDPRYEFDRLAETVKVTAYDIRYGWGARTGEGSGYTLGALDGTWRTTLFLAPNAINVSLFRPYFWEVRNPLMLLSAGESFVVLLLTLYVLWKVKFSLFYYLKNPEILFCIVFSLTFAFAVGVSTYNFGTLSRYKIPLLQYYLLGLGLIYYYWKKDRKFSEFDSTE
jgi:hypothetical protein